MRIGVLQGVHFKLLLLKKSDEAHIELEVVRLNWGLTMLEGMAFGSRIVKSLDGVVVASMLTA